ncbi:hypothetical protein RR46_13844 [Papilio xuthus]|uniref:Uncharacterized protein n=1 Tax=Papilio xuthus TaxID=66420 RepID=A0A194PHU8_PAPXU|nr:hypothetical protein RR46_13844 [Papilio xuthus]
MIRKAYLFLLKVKAVVFTTLLCVSTSFAIKTKVEEPKDKRETLTGYPGAGHSSHSYQAPSYGQGSEEASAISVGAGYSIGGAKPSYSFGAPGSESGYQLSAESHPSSGHSPIQLAPITLQSNHGSLVGNDLSQLMSQISHGLNSGAITLQQTGGQGGGYQLGNLGAHGGQEYSLPQYSFGSPKLQQQFAAFEQSQSVPSYAAGTKGLGSYGSTGPVLFSPAESHGNQATLSYGAPSAGHSFGDSGSLSLGNAGHSLSGYSLGNQGQVLGGQYASLGGGYAAPGKAFKPSAFLGSSVQSDSGHALSSLSGSYGAPSFGGSHGGSSSHGAFVLGSGGHGASFGGSLGNLGGSSSKFIAPTYLPSKSEGFGSLESIAAFSSGGHLDSPRAGTYGIPSGSFSHQATSSNSPQYYVTSSKHSLPSGSFSSGPSYRGATSGHSSLNSYSSGPKYSFGGSSSRYGSPKDSHGAYSETSYNTIKYSEELKPRVH